MFFTLFSPVSGRVERIFKGALRLSVITWVSTNALNSVFSQLCGCKLKYKVNHNILYRAVRMHFFYSAKAAFFKNKPNKSVFDPS